MTTKICYHHWHDGNDPWTLVVDAETKEESLVRKRGTAVYATQAKVVDLETGVVLAEEWAFCSPNDPPSRKVGREVTTGRLRKALEQEAAARLANQSRVVL